MGNYFTVNMEENFKNNQEFIQTINKIKVRFKFCYLLKMDLGIGIGNKIN